MANLVLDLGYGIILIVIFVACGLFGVGCCQAYNFYTRYPKDHVWLKLYVASILLLDALSTFFACLWQFELAIVHWGQDSVAQTAQNSPFFALNPLFCGIIGFLVHTFFARRIYIITESKWLTGFILLFALCAVAGALGTSIAALLQIGFARFRKLPFGQMWLVGSVIADTIITGALTYHLRKRRGDFENTNHILDRIVRLTVQNGLLTSVTALTDLVLFLIFGSPTHTVSFLIPKLYSNTVLSSLNSRRVEAEQDSWSMSAVETHTRHQSMHVSKVRARSGVSTAGGLRFASPPTEDTKHLAIEINTEREGDHEANSQYIRPISTETALTGVMSLGWRSDTKSSSGPRAW